MNEPMETKDEGRFPSAAEAAMAVLLAALVMGFYDLTCAGLSESFSFDIASSLTSLLPLHVVALPAILGLASLVLAGADAALGRMPGPAAWRAAAQGLLWAGSIAALVPALFSGPAIARSAWRWPLISATLMAVTALAAGLRLAVVVLHRRFSRPDSRPWLAGPLVAAAGIAALALAHQVNRRVLFGLYRPFHQGISLAVLLGVAAVILVLLARVEMKTTSRRVALGLVLAAAAGLVGGLATLRLGTLGRQALAEDAPFVAPFLGSITQLQNRWMGALGPVEASFRPPGGPSRSAFAHIRFPDRGARRSVLLITVDALRGDALDDHGPFSRSTPGLRTLARSAVRFSRAYSAANLTHISVPSMLAGRVVAAGWDELAEAELLPAVFRKADYRTQAFFTGDDMPTVLALLPRLRRVGFFFDQYDPAYQGVEDILPRVRRALDETGPVFLWVHLREVHMPYLLAYSGKGRRPLYPATYEGQLAFLDAILAPFLEDENQAGRDLVWALAADHGEAFGEHNTYYHGNTMYDEQIRIPILVHAPGMTPVAIPEPVSLVDLGATLLALAGASVPADVPRLPLAPGPARGAGILALDEGSCALIQGPLKLMVNPSDARIALYDLERDPAETVNLIAERKDRIPAMLDALRRLGCPYNLAMFR